MLWVTARKREEAVGKDDEEGGEEGYHGVIDEGSGDLIGGVAVKEKGVRNERQSQQGHQRHQQKSQHEAEIHGGSYPEHAVLGQLGRRGSLDLGERVEQQLEEELGWNEEKLELVPEEDHVGGVGGHLRKIQRRALV